jgi:hypothetical protein
MNGNAPKIEIFAPFGAAYEWMKTMLFRPFDAAKWFVIAFAAFLGGNFGPNFHFNYGNGDWKYRATTQGNTPADWNLTPWIIGLAIAVVLIALVLGLAWMWISSRGRFIFTDCVVKNRAAIADPWREFRREGNSYFLFSLVVGLCFFVLLAIVGVGAWFLFFGKEGGAKSVAIIVLLAVMVLFLVVLSLSFALVSHFMVPVMYRLRCSAREAFRDVTKLILANPGPFVLYVLFLIVLTVALAIVTTTVACMTCCIGALPYISTVLLLPAIVWLAAFNLLFLRQFGDRYDVWATIGYPQAVASPPVPPPGEALPPSLPPPPA